MTSKATTVQQYLRELPEERRKMVEAVRAVIRANLDPVFEEGMLYGMIGYYLPHSVYPAGYHCDPRQPLPFAHLASQKNHLAIYLFCNYTNPERERWFRREWARTGKKLNMGKSCVRFRKLEDLALEVIGESIRRFPAAEYIREYESALAATGRKAPAKGAASRKRAVARTGARAPSRGAASSPGAKKRQSSGKS